MKKEFVDQLSIILAKKNLINLDDLVMLHKKFYDQGDISFEDFLIEEDIVEKEDLLNALSEYYNVPSFDVNGITYDHIQILRIPKGVLLRHLFLPINRENEDMLMVAANPNDPNLYTVMGQYFNANYVINVGLASDIRNAINEFYDQPITYQPNPMEAQRMERSQVDVHPLGETIRQDLSNNEVPEDIEETDDDYEQK